jgi:uncharacterized membrane protein YcaP (DUF421 family)
METGHTLMEKEEIHITDLYRIIFGETPPVFFIEVVIRISFIYLLLLVSMRLMGKRMASSLSRTEQVSMVSLAAAIGIPLQAPDRGLLPAVVIAAVVVIFARIISYFSLKSTRFENMVQDRIGLLVKDSVLQLKQMKHISVSHERLFAQLRSEGIKNLGEVQRLYIEANGTFTLIKKPKASEGLCLIPAWDKEFLAQQIKSTEYTCCSNCGYKRSVSTDDKDCPVCQQRQWIAAYASEN